MNETGYPEGGTALLFIDPYNDFLAEDGKMWPMVSAVATSVDLHANLARVRSAVREAGIPIFILPHHRSRPTDFQGWAHPTPFQPGAHAAQAFAADSRGGDWYPGFGPEPGDIVVTEHWSGSSFANTDLDVQLRQHGVSHVILIGLIANTCVETTGPTPPNSATTSPWCATPPRPSRRRPCMPPTRSTARLMRMPS